MPEARMRGTPRGDAAFLRHGFNCRLSLTRPPVIRSPHPRRLSCELDQPHPPCRSSPMFGRIAPAPDRIRVAGNRGESQSVPERENANASPTLPLSGRSRRTRPPAYCSRLEALAKQSDDLAAMDFAFPVQSGQGSVFRRIQCSGNRCDTSFYDLLASEARLCSYVAIALGQVPQDHWFSLGRLLVASARRSAARFMERLDVRISDAACWSCPTMRTPCWTTPTRRRSNNRSSMENPAACRGEFPSPATTGRMSCSTISIMLSACRVWD